MRLHETISVGAALFPHDADELWECIRLADASLYAAKESGRNRVVRHGKAQRSPPALPSSESGRADEVLQ